MNRNLDGAYFRINRDNKWQNICFSDLTDNEREKVMQNRDTEWLKRMCKILAYTIKSIGDQFDIICGEEDDQ